MSTQTNETGGVLAVLEACEAYVDDAAQFPEQFKRGVVKRHQREYRQARAAVAGAVKELRKAHEIILLALNELTPAAKLRFERKVIAAGLDGEGTTRYHERIAALARAGGDE